MVKQARAQETRESVLFAAARVFERRGFAGARIEEILSEAGVTKGALYFHFDSKEALAETILSDQGDWDWGSRPHSGFAIQRIIDTTYLQTGELLVSTYARARMRLLLERTSFGDGDPEPYRAWQETIVATLREAEAAGELRPGVDIERAARVIHAVGMGAHLLSEALSGRSDFGRRMDDIWLLLLPTLITDEVAAQLTVGHEHYPHFDDA